MGPKLMSYEWMTRHTPQEEWIEGGGKFIWLALFCTETGAGLFFVSLFFKNPVGMLLGWFLCLALGGGFFLVHMGHPLRPFDQFKTAVLMDFKRCSASWFFWRCGIPLHYSILPLARS